MPEDVGLDEAAPEAPPVQRILFPSALGAIGVELTGESLTRVVIVPKGKERKLFTPFGDLKRGQRSELLEEVVGRFSEYLAGARRKIDVGYDLRALGFRGFPRRVMKETARVGYGRTRTYQQIATAAGNPEGYRQVLSILIANPIPLAVPCHRIVPHRVGAGSYVAGAKKKEWLLKLEKRGLTLL